jgi:hypothetical protein
MKITEIYEHYNFYVDSMEIEEPISFELWVSEYLTDLEEILSEDK